MSKYSKINIIVGCGGSGAKIAKSLSHLMGQDPAWKHVMNENVYFLLIDTSMRELAENAKIVSVSAPNVHVETILTTAGYTTPAEIVDDLLDAVNTVDPSTSSEACKRFSEHWWCGSPQGSDAKDIQEFDVKHVRDLVAGAGQVPMVSYLATWACMKGGPRNPNSIEKSILDLCEEIARDRVGIVAADGNGPLSNFNVLFAGSLVGGTGRGCFVPIAFKLKEIFYNKFRSIPLITAYALDQSCFAGVRASKEKLPQMLNSITGWSELSVWMSNYYDDTIHGYTLPGRLNIHDPANDSLKSLLMVSTGDGGVEEPANRMKRGGLPFDSVGIICGSSPAGYDAESPESIYEMTATAIYMELTKSEIGAAHVNKTRNYFSVGSSVTQIPYDKIEKYFRNIAALAAADSLTSKLPDEVVAAAADELLALLGFSDPQREFLGYMRDEEKGSPMLEFARNCYSENGFLNERLSDLQSALTAQNLSECERLIEELLGECVLEDRNFLEQIANRYIGSVCSYFNSKSADAVVRDSAALENLILERLISFLKATGSVVALEQVAKAFDVRLTTLVDDALSKRGVESWYHDEAMMNPPSTVAKLEEVKGKDGFMGLSGVRFSDDEIAEVMDVARKELAGFVLRALAKSFSAPVSNDCSSSGFFVRLRKLADQIKFRSAFLLKCSYTAQQRMDLSELGLKDLRRKLFASEDLESEIKDIGVGMHILRDIRPLYPDESELHLDCGKAVEFVADVMRGVDLKGNVIAMPTANDRPLDKQDWLRKLQDAFMSAKYEGVFEDGRQGDIMEKFRLREVLRALSVKWRNLLQEVWNHGEKDRYHVLVQAFRNYYGITPTVLGGETIEISGDEDMRGAAGEDYLMLGLAAAASRTCRPFWKTTDGAELSPQLTVQVPVSLTPREVEAWKRQLQRLSNLQVADSNSVTLIANQIAGTEEEHNPYILAVYTSTEASDLDHVESLNVWRDEKLHHFLRLAEQEDDLMPFNPKLLADWEHYEKDDYRGSGFSDPRYIMKPEFRRNRWRPWMPKEEQEKQNQQDDGSKLAFLSVYATLGPKWYIEAALGEEQAKGILAASGLSGDPIFSEGERKMFKLGRLPVRIRAGKASIDDADIRIKVGSNVTQSIRTLPEILAGKREARSLKGGGTDHLLELGKSVESEYDDFFGAFAEMQGFHPSTAKAAHLKMLQKLKDYFINEREKSKPNQEDGDREFWHVVLTAQTKKIDDLEG